MWVQEQIYSIVSVLSKYSYFNCFIRYFLKIIERFKWLINAEAEADIEVTTKLDNSVIETTCETGTLVN